MVTQNATLGKVKGIFAQERRSFVIFRSIPHSQDNTAQAEQKVRKFYLILQAVRQNANNAWAASPRKEQQGLTLFSR
jgi:hypothetical protein